MWRRLLSASNLWLGSLMGRPVGEVSKPVDAPERSQAFSGEYGRIERVVLTDQVSRTLFSEYASHREGERGEEEIGWVLLGLREADHALVLATLPAGANRDAGVAHVQFNSDAQAVASRIVRQWDGRLLTLGVLHTHPGSLRHPSDGDFQGDSAWVGRLRGSEGIFGIGTADGPAGDGLIVGQQPRPNVLGLGGLMFSWYALRAGDRQYRPLPAQLTIGPDLALPLHQIWTTIEWFAEPLERLCQQQAKASFQVVSRKDGVALAVNLKLAEPNNVLQVMLEGEKKPEYFWQRGSEILAVAPPADQLDRAVYLILANIAGRMGCRG